MPSPRPSNFVSAAPSAPPERARPRRHRAPQSPGLPPSGIDVDKEARIRRANPAKRGRPNNEARDAMVSTVLARLTDKPREIALDLGRGVEAKPIKAIIKTARELFASRAAEYVEIHLAAAQIAALQGDAKPAEWALERIAEGGERVVDSPKAAPPAAPTFNLGFVIGGVPQQAITSAAERAELPVLAGTVAPVDMP